MSDELIQRLRSLAGNWSVNLGKSALEAIALIEQQAALILSLESRTAQQARTIAAMCQQVADLERPVAPAVDAQPVAIVTETHDSRGKPDLYTIMATSKLRIGDRLYASAQSEGLRKDAEELLRRIPTTPEQMIDFIGSHFNSMEAQEWSEFSGDARAKPAGDLSMVRYSLTVHDLLSAFDWADLSEHAIDAALSQHTGEKDD